MIQISICVLAAMLSGCSTNTITNKEVFDEYLYFVGFDYITKKELLETPEAWIYEVKEVLSKDQKFKNVKPGYRVESNTKYTDEEAFGKVTFRSGRDFSDPFSIDNVEKGDIKYNVSVIESSASTLITKFDNILKKQNYTSFWQEEKNCGSGFYLIRGSVILENSTNLVKFKKELNKIKDSKSIIIAEIISSKKQEQEVKKQLSNKIFEKIKKKKLPYIFKFNETDNEKNWKNWLENKPPIKMKPSKDTTNRENDKLRMLYRLNQLDKVVEEMLESYTNVDGVPLSEQNNAHKEICSYIRTKDFINEKINNIKDKNLTNLISNIEKNIDIIVTNMITKKIITKLDCSPQVMFRGK